MISTDGRLAIVPRDRDREPKQWDIHYLQMHDVGFTRTMPFAVFACDCRDGIQTVSRV